MKRNVIISFLLVSTYTSVFSQTYNMTSSASYTTCSGNFYDDGGPSGSYSPNQNVTVTFKPPNPSDKLSVTFTSFQAWGDTLYVFDGNSTSAPLIGRLNGGVGIGTITSSAADGSLTFKFISNQFQSPANEAGWAATIACNITPADVTMLASGTFTKCSGNFYDGGGPTGYYMADQNVITTLKPPNASDKLSVTFTSFQAWGDTLYVFDGNSTSAPLLRTLKNNDVPGIITSSAIDGSLTFKFISNQFQSPTNEAGWAATISCSASLPSNIKITNSQIPPWQREEDELVGSITAHYSGMPIGANIRIDIYVDGNLAGSTAQWATTNAAGTRKFDFNLTKDFFTTVKPKEGNKVGYQLIYNSTTFEDASVLTNIIEKKWDKKNIVYFNSIGNKIIIPLKYYFNTAKVEIKFSRDYNTYEPCGLLDKGCADKYEDILVNSSFTQNDNLAYLTLNSNINIINNLPTVEPGVFTYTVKYRDSNGNIINDSEISDFELTKIGKINTSQSNKVVVFIAGIWNAIEFRAHDIKQNPHNYNSLSSDKEYSIISSIGDITGYQTWYIAQTNANYTQRNAHSIGLALDSIKRISNASEIILVCHSKGGIDTRALLSNMACSYKNHSSISYPPSTQDVNKSGNFKIDLVSLPISKVVFLASPHNGANNLSWGGHLNEFWNSGSPALREMLKKFGYNTIDILNTKGVVPKEIKIANITAYTQTMTKTLSNSNAKLQNHYSLAFDDGQVPGKSSDAISQEKTHLTYSDNSLVDVIQMYQHYEPKFIGDFPHINIHSNYCLSNTNPKPYSYINQTNNFNNLEKIINFIKGESVISCKRPDVSKIIVATYSSILSGTSVSRKFTGDTLFYELGFTGENGEFNGSIIPLFQIGDSLKLSSPGYETLVVAVDSNIITNGKVDIIMLKSTIPTNKIKNPSLKLINKNPITNNNTVNLETNGENVLSYQKNNPFNQDSLFVPLSLINNKFTAQLDTGFNFILVKFIGVNDTVVLAKEIYYLPDSLMTQNTYRVSINANSASIGTKIYVNNQFVKEIVKSSDTIPVLTGQNIFKFTKFGYIDSLVTVDSATTINLSLQLFPLSYSSPVDSNIVDFPANGKLQYRRNVTMLDSAQKSIISIKQIDDNISGKGLVPKSRKFEFRHLNAPNWSNIKTAMVLDQITNLSVDSIYLMKVSNDSIFSKIAFNNSGNIAGYDSLVQKLTFNYINFDSGRVKKEALVIMKKQAPILKINSTINANQISSFQVPLFQLFSDPDSIKNDMSYQIVNATPTGLSISISNGIVMASINSCFSGNTSFTIRATHDGLSVNNTVNVSVNSLPPLANPISGSNNVLLGQTLDYSIGSVSGTSGYNWQLSGGGIIKNGQNTNTVTIDWTTAGSHTLTVNGINNCGNGEIRSQVIDVSVGTGIVNPDDQFQIKLIPNPSSGEFYFTAKGLINKNIKIDVLNNLGQIIYRTEQRALSNDFYKLLDLSKFPDGIYNVRILVDKKYYLRRITKLN